MRQRRAPFRLMKQSAVECISTPNPYFEHDVNAYVIRGEPLTLVDTGIGMEEAWEALLQGLTEISLRVEDIQQIILTHKHPDHFGLARRIQRASRARVFIHEDDREDILQFAEQFDQWVASTEARLRRWGAPEGVIEDTRPALRATAEMAESLDAEPLQEGQQLPVNGMNLEVLHTPGHTRGSICLRYGNALLTGDHVLPQYTPNIGGSDRGGHGLLQHYLDSLERVRSLCGAGLEVLPGHGRSIPDLAARVDFMIEHHRRRSWRILKILSEQKDQTTWEVASRLFGDLQGIHVLLGLGEVDAHFEYLEDQGQIRSSDGRYAPV